MIPSDGMTRPKDEGIPWRFEVQPLLQVKAECPGEVVTAQMAIDLDEPEFRFRTISYTHVLVEGGPAQPSAPPLDEIEAFANQPRNVVALFDQRARARPAIEIAPMLLTDVKKPGKKPDSFYGEVLIYKRACEEVSTPFAERIARDNDVTAGVVYRWVQEAKRRGITIDDDEIGQVRINGEPMDLLGLPWTFEQHGSTS